MSSELQKASETNSVTVFQETLEQFKALFYLAKGKRDTQIKLFHGNKLFSKQSIIDLNDKVEQKLLNYSISNKLTSISINLSGNNIKSYGNWQEFLNEPLNTSEKTQTVTITWDFEMVLPNRIHTIPQTHSLKVRLGNELKPNEIFHMMIVGGDGHEFEEAQAQMVAKVDFINNTIATELLALVSEWYNVLLDNGFENKLNKFLIDHGFKLRMFLEVCIIFACLALLYPIVIYFIDTTGTDSTIAYFKTNFLLINSAFLAYSAGVRIANLYARKYDRTISKLSNNPIFNFTSGDKNELEKIEKKNKGLRREIFMKLFISFISAGILYTLGHGINWLIEFIKNSN